MKIGDVVMLKSGGPEMTVYQVDDEIVTAIYFDLTSCDYKRCQLPEPLLKIVSSDEEILTEGNF